MTNILQDNSNDRNYFIQVPQIILAISRTPQDFTLWCVIKTIAGENGECFLSTPDLAVLAMMSEGKVSDSRKYLIAVGVLHGELRKDPGHPQPVWHLQIPDIWELNIVWRKRLNSLKERVSSKKEFARLHKENGTLRTFDGTKPIIDIKSLHNMKPSQYEGGIPQNETKKNQPEPTNTNVLTKTFLKDKFLSLTGVSFPVNKGTQSFWWSRFRELENIFAGYTPEEAGGAMRNVILKMKEDDLTVSSPKSIENLCRAYVSQRRNNGTHSPTGKQTLDSDGGGWV